MSLLLLFPSAAAGGGEVIGDVSVTFEDMTVAATGQLTIQGVLSVTFDAMTVTAFQNPAVSTSGAGGWQSSVIS